MKYTYDTDGTKHTRCTMYGCVLPQDHGGPHGMNWLDYQPDLPPPTNEENAEMLKFFHRHSNDPENEFIFIHHTK